MILNYCIMVTGPAYSKQHTSSALQFVKTLLKCNHQINTIFFYKDGVGNANNFNISDKNEFNIIFAWCELAKKYKIKLHICFSAAMRRGIINNKQAIIFNHKHGNLNKNFKLISLGQFVQSLLICNRFIQF